MNFVEHLFRAGHRPSGVYRLVFDGKYFYFGSTGNLKSRMSRWKHVLFFGKVQNANINKILPTCETVAFEVLDFIEDKNMLRPTEDLYIKSHIGADYLLNVTADARGPISFKKGPNSNKRIFTSISEDHKRRISAAIKDISDEGVIYACNRKSINQYNKSGELIASHISISQAARDIGLDTSVFQAAHQKPERSKTTVQRR